MIDPGALCETCGLCCDGTLFTHAPLRVVEVEPMRALGLPILTRADGVPALAQRCGALDGPRCTIYLQRPNACRLFECNLLHAYRDGEVSLDDARALIEEAKVRAGDDAWLDRHFRGRNKRPR